jgi:uncharacterized membrane protein
MQVRFRNQRSSKVWVAIMRYDPSGCGSYGNWATAGWWGVNPGQLVHAFNTSNRYACFYAEGDDGTIWTGPYGPMYVYWDAFSSCVGIGSTAAYDVVGLRLIDLGSGAWNPWATHTVNLV